MTSSKPSCSIRLLQSLTSCTPVIVEGRMWGAIAAGSTLEEPLPPDAEERLVSFTELVATAIANADSRAELLASRASLV
jgi:GAF domain-containing protein